MKKMIVVGAGKGLGNGVAEMFGSKDFRVILMARSEQHLKEYAADFSEKGIEAYTKAADATDFDAFEKAFREVVDMYGTPDVLFYNVGITVADEGMKITAQTLVDRYAVDVAGAYNCIKLVDTEEFAEKKGTVQVTGVIGSNDHFAPKTIAEEFWKLYTKQEEILKVHAVKMTIWSKSIPYLRVRTWLYLPRRCIFGQYTARYCKQRSCLQCRLRRLCKPKACAGSMNGCAGGFAATPRSGLFQNRNGGFEIAHSITGTLKTAADRLYAELECLGYDKFDGTRFLQLRRFFLEYAPLFKKLPQTVVVAVFESVAVLGQTFDYIVYFKAERVFVKHEEGSPHYLVQLSHASKVLKASRAEAKLLAVCGTFYIRV